MNLDLWLVKYNGMGGHPVVSYIGDFLLPDSSESFGSAIETVEIYAHLASAGQPRKTLESMAESFRERLAKLPQTRFKRKARVFEIAYHSKLGDGEEMLKWQPDFISLEMFHEGCREIVTAVSLIGPRLKRTDDFDFRAFESYLRRRLDEVPTSVAELRKVLDELKARAQQRIAAAENAWASQRKSHGLPKGGPKTVALDPDDYAAQYVGWTKNGRQFFLTTPFVPAINHEAGREFIALYLFDKAGALLSATIDDLGPRATMDEALRAARRDELLASLGDVRYHRIKIAPFTVERFGIEFGFIPQPPELPGEEWSVIVEPGDYMCFWPPWTSGDYDT
jgi:hypothetical protein